MRRRDVIVMLGAAALLDAHAAGAQEPVPQARVALLRASAAPAGDRGPATFVDTLQRLGWVQGRNLEIRAWYSGNDSVRLPSVVHDIVAWKPNVIATSGNNLTNALRENSSNIPIVFEYGNDPIRAGWATSIAHPAGRLTGISASSGIDLWPKRLSLLRSMIPSLHQVGVLIATTSPTSADAALRALSTVTTQRNIDLRVRNVSQREEIESVVEHSKSEGDQAILVVWQTFSALYAGEIVRATSAQGVPSIYELRDSAELGGLMSYGSNRIHIRERQAVYVDKILRGAAPGDLPIELPAAFELVLNLKTASALGLTVPADLLAQADEIIE